MEQGNEPAANEDVTGTEDLMAYDQLPPALRRALSRVPYNFSSSEILRLYHELRPLHGEYDTVAALLDWHGRCVQTQRQLEIQEGRLCPQ